MKAAVYTKYGPPEVLSLLERPQPTFQHDEVLIKVFATTVSSGDCRLRALRLPEGFGFLGRLIFGITGPRNSILGTELSGVVEAVGPKVTKFRPGDQVFAFSGSQMGSYVEYKCFPETGMIMLKPKNLSFQEAAALSFGGTTALYFLKQSKIKQGDRILVIGASGCVGMAVVQIAKHFGAHVTGVCSGKNRELVLSIGADAVIDYTQTDFAKNGKTYDVIADTVGAAPFSICKDSLTETGKLLLILAGLPAMLEAPKAHFTSKKKVILGTATEKVQDLHELAALAESGKFRPHIDRIYPFKDIVEAHRYADSGRKLGSVILDVNLPTFPQ